MTSKISILIDEDVAAHYAKIGAQAGVTPEEAMQVALVMGTHRVHDLDVPAPTPPLADSVVKCGSCANPISIGTDFQHWPMPKGYLIQNINEEPDSLSVNCDIGNGRTVRINLEVYSYREDGSTDSYELCNNCISKMLLDLTNSYLLSRTLADGARARRVLPVGRQVNVNGLPFSLTHPVVIEGFGSNFDLANIK